MLKVAVFVIALLVVAPDLAQSRVQDFCADEPISHPASVPKNVLTMLLEKDTGKDGIELNGQLLVLVIRA